MQDPKFELSVFKRPKYSSQRQGLPARLIGALGIYQPF